MNEATLRAVLGLFTTGVTVVTATGPDGPIGVTANSFASVSLDPALVLFCIHRASRIRPALTDDGPFAINILAAHQEPLSRRFAGPVERRTEGVRFHHGVTGAPVLTDATAYLDCDLYRQFDAGDHVVVIGRVRDHGVQHPGHRPLTFYRGRYGTVEDPDHGLIAPVAVPADHRVPDAVTGLATPAEYDRYFRLVRSDVGLAEWTRSCLDVNREVIDELQSTSLSGDDRLSMVTGLVAALDITLSQWLAVAQPEESAA